MSSSHLRSRGRPSSWWTAALLVLASLSSPALGLDPARPPWRNVHDYWDVDSGLPQGSVNALAQTRDGYIWVGTYDGLARFDGFTSTILRPGTTPGLESASIRALLADPDGRLWIGTGGGGLSVRTHGEIRVVAGTQGMLVRAIAEEPSGMLWVGTTSRGLFRIPPGRGPEPVPVAPGVDSVNAILLTRDGEMWIGTTGQGLWHRKGEGPFLPLDDLAGKLVSALYQDREGTLWIGTVGAGAFALGRDGNVRRFGQADGLGSQIVFAFLGDNAGALWIATAGGGVVRMNAGRFERHTRATGLSHDVVSALLEDSEGSLWIGTAAAGIVRIQGGSFSSFTIHDGLPDEAVYSCAIDAGGKIWAVTAGGGLCSSGGEGFKVEAFPGSTSHQPVRSVAIGRSGDLWIATYGGGVLRRSAGAWRRYTHVDGLPHDSVRTILVDSAGIVWATTVGGLGRFAQGRWTTLDSRPGLPTNSLISLAEGPDGALWIGTDGSGLVRLAGGKVSVFTRKDGLASDVILALRWGRGGLWIGTNGGLSRLKAGRFTSWSTKDGLASDNVSQLSEEPTGALWVGSAGGVARISPESFEDGPRPRGLTIRNFGRSDGMPSIQCSAPSNGPAVGPDGRLWFPTLRGLAVVDPARLEKDDVPPIVHIEGVVADGKDFGTGESISLPPATARLEVRYTGICTRAGHLVRFRYKLAGFDQDWVEAGSRRTAYFTAVPPGSYRFLVQATNADGAMAEGSLGLVLTPLFWQTRLFRAATGVGIVVVLLAFAVVRSRTLRTRQARLERQVAERTTQLVAASERAEAASRAKADFLATMSHEMRTPLNAVVGLSGLLLGTKLDETQRDWLETARLSADALLSLINDVLDFSKIEAGKYELEVVEGDVVGLVEETAGILAVAAREKGLELVFEVAPEIPSRLKGDLSAIRQVLLNLASNAVKFTAQGEVVIRAEMESATASFVTVRFTVSDTGIGIPREKQSEVFESFTQVESAMTRTKGGTGLGLAISRRLCELMGGAIGVESEPGKGSTFWFTAVLERAGGTSTGPMVFVPELQGRRLLVVDDSPASRGILSALLSRWGASVTAASGGEEAMAELRAGAGRGEPYALALVDAEMPRMSGEALGREVKADPALRSTHLILLHWTGRRGDAALAQASGFAGYLSKPARPSVLLRCLRDVLSGRNSSGDESALVVSPSGRRGNAGRRILVAEDNAINSKVIAAQLLFLGYRADTVGTGREAVEAMDLAPYDLVLMDCQMPELDGYQAAAKIRTREAGGRRVPIVAVTAHALREDRSRCLAAGMDDYVTKPLTLERLELVLNRWLGEAREPEPAAADAGPPESGEPVSLETLARASMGDEALRRELVALFVNENAERLNAIERSLEAGDLETARREAHTMKGVSSTLGAAALSRLAARFEERARTDSSEEWTGLLLDLQREHDRVVRFLREHVLPEQAS